jgi:hypothetical protein
MDAFTPFTHITKKVIHMKCTIHTNGFQIDRTEDFGVSKDICKDSYVIIDGALIINSFNGVYLYEEAHRAGKWIFVPPQPGRYEGPAAGLDRMYGFNQRITGVTDITTSIPGGEGKILSSSQYQYLRSKADLPSLGHPFDPVPMSDPFEADEDDSFHEMELEMELVELAVPKKIIKIARKGKPVVNLARAETLILPITLKIDKDTPSENNDRLQVLAPIVDLDLVVELMAVVRADFEFYSGDNGIFAIGCDRLYLTRVSRRKTGTVIQPIDNKESAAYGLVEDLVKNLAMTGYQMRSSKNHQRVTGVAYAVYGDYKHLLKDIGSVYLTIARDDGRYKSDVIKLEIVAETPAPPDRSIYAKH